MNNPKYSILIPTRNGEKYIISSINSVISQAYNDFELIVSVNHSTDDTLSKVLSIKNERLVVTSPPKPLSLALHQEWILRQATGKWIVMIGDDDGLMPFFFQEADRLLKKTRETYLAYSLRRAYFFWPGCEDLYKHSVVSIVGNSSIYSINSRWILFQIILGLKNHTDLPEAYACNIISNSLITSIRARSGGIFYHDQAPDVYSGIAIALSVKYFCRSELPLIWVGSSTKSIGFSHGIVNSAEIASKGSLQSQVVEDNYALMGDYEPRAACEVGDDLLVSAHSDPIFALSALLNTPLASPASSLFKRAIIYIAFSTQMLLIRKMGKTHTSEKAMQSLLLQISKLGINIVFLGALSRFINLIWYIPSLGDKIKSRFKQKNDQVENRFVSEAREQFESLEQAQEAAKQWYSAIH